jgi:uncharacterized protein YbjT (DUF2867 family)
MKRALVTGATGTVGRQVVSPLLATGARVRADPRPGRRRLPPWGRGGARPGRFVPDRRADLTRPKRPRAGWRHGA